MAACPRPFSMIAVWFAVKKHIFHCHIARRIGIMVAVSHHLQQYIQLAEGKHIIIPLSLCDATWHPETTTIHHWWKGNIYSIVMVLDDLAPGDSHPSYTVVYTIDGGHRLYRVVWKSQAAWTYLCAKQTVAYTKKWYGCVRIVFGGCGRRSQCIRRRALSPCRNIRGTSIYKIHSSAHVSISVLGEHRKYGSLHRSLRFVLGIRRL